MSVTIASRKSTVLEEILALAREKFSATDPEPVVQFLREYFRPVPEDDMLSRPAADLCAAALAHRQFGSVRTPGRSIVRVFRAEEQTHGWTSADTVVEMVNDDRPFLLDSTLAALQRLGLTVDLTIHPILTVQRDSEGRLREVVEAESDSGAGQLESFIHVEVSHPPERVEPEQIREELESVMADVKIAVEQWQPMRSRALSLCQGLEGTPGVDPAALREVMAFLDWVAEDHFTFVGVADYDLHEEDGRQQLRLDPGSALGVLRRPGSRVTQAEQVLPHGLGTAPAEGTLLVLTKADSRSTMHRASYLDSIAVKRFDARGEVVGESRLVGLYTAGAYHRSPRGIPLLRGKVERVMRASGLRPTSHAGRMLLNIMDTLPRDELFQAADTELLEITTGILNLQERQRTRLFLRRDPYGRFYSCLVFIPRDRYQREVRERVEALLCRLLDGHDAESTVQVGDSPLARVHVIVRCRDPEAPSPEVESIEASVVDAVRTWQDELWTALARRHGEDAAVPLYRRYARAFPAGYREDFNAAEAVEDIGRAEALRGTGALQMHLYRSRTGAGDRLGLKLLQPGEQLYLSDVLPVLENMGLRVLSEHPYEVHPDGSEALWLHDFTLHCDQPVVVEDARSAFEEAFARVWHGGIENDGFNRLTLLAGLGWRQVSVLRMYCKYLLQTGVSFSQSYMEQTLAEHAPVAARLVELFERRFDPSATEGRERDCLALAQALDDALDRVASADHDRILRGFLHVVRATVRTNYFQATADGEPKAAISVKLDPETIPQLPEPRPRYEIFVYSPAVEAVHLRGGKVARGGIRWSDRREDFRTEVLGLMKAQMVKNAVIVPVGAKGGFVCKRLPEGGGREAVQQEVIACYSTFMRSMLDLTDNYVGEECVSPPDLVRLDDDDPYLVVAADKGTASFSDIANGIAHEYGLWLGDAFASGGSSGYDHKEMAITARGAWESVRRHFREMGHDLDSEPFTAVGIGDMSGDVFGNGMLLSNRVRLVAAFNHRHIFVDPDPDPEASFVERKRLFDTPGSAWSDYDSDRISTGGGVFPRSAKSIRLTPEMRRVLDVDAESLTPQELIRTILCAPVDLLWNGGIGTYVRASHEANLSVGDRANDAVRVHGAELRCRVVGEGGNLGMTQLGRIEYALAGGRLNTDFIDNSAGVDCSDHEVNIKILFNGVMEEGLLTLAERDRLLRDMTDEVAGLVLRDNYLQTQAISMMEANAAGQLDEHAFLIGRLEATAGLDRALEFLPDEEELSLRRARNTGLTRPELAVLLCYAKIAVYDALRESSVPEDPYLEQELELYFPDPLRGRFRDWMYAHRLRREIIANAVTNSMINRMGVTFAQRLEDELGASAAEVARAYACAREIFDARSMWTAVEQLDGRVDGAVQVEMMNAIGALLEHGTRWFLGRPGSASDVSAAVENHAGGVSELARAWPELVPDNDAQEWLAAVSRYEEAGASAEVARRMAGLEALFPALDIVAAARETDLPVQGVASLYFRLAAELGLDWLVEEVDKLSTSDHWRARARNGLREDLYGQYASLVRSALADAPGDRPLTDGHLEAWMEANREALERFQRLVGDIRAAGRPEPAALAVGVRELRRLASGPATLQGGSSP
ncbi:MAG TPA: NAD-glutamate dehydrogenase [Gammaproteobacteria bacterium]|nr:NAD-glutamate dehydrogenase [Gammaproteobacteria bacterium]